MKVAELLEAKVRYAQSKDVIKKLRDSGMMEPAGWYHKRGGDWEDTTVLQPRKKRKKRT